jgi:hypothetical protein
MGNPSSSSVAVCRRLRVPVPVRPAPAARMVSRAEPSRAEHTPGRAGAMPWAHLVPVSQWSGMYSLSTTKPAAFIPSQSSSLPGRTCRAGAVHEPAETAAASWRRTAMAHRVCRAIAVAGAHLRGDRERHAVALVVVVEPEPGGRVDRGEGGALAVVPAVESVGGRLCRGPDAVDVDVVRR